MNISSLTVELKLQADNFNNQIKAAQKEAKEFEKSVKPSMDLLKDMGTAMAAAGGVIVGSMLAMTKSAADYGESLKKASQITGASVEDLARLGFAADQNEASFATMSTGLKFLAKNMEGAIDGSKSQLKGFQDLGISADDLAAAHDDLNEVFLLVADRFKEMPDGAEKTAAAMAIFGRSGTELIPTLNLGSEGLKLFGDEAERLGIVMSGEAADASDQFNDTLSAVSTAVQGLAVSVGTALMPALTSVAEVIRDTIVDVTAFAKEHETLTQVIFGVGLALVGAGGLLLGITAVGAVIGPLTIGLAAIGGAATLAVAGVVALGAALGVGIGMLVNYGLEVTGLQKNLDAVTGLLFSGRAAVASSEMATATQKLSDKLKDQGIVIVRGIDTVGEWNQRVTDAARLSGNFKVTAEASTAAVASHTTGIDKSGAAYDDWAKKAEAARKVIAGVITGNTADMSQHVDTLKSDSDAWIAHMTKLYVEERDAGLKAAKEYQEGKLKEIRDAQSTIDSIMATNAANMGTYLETEAATNLKWIQEMGKDWSDAEEKKTKDTKDALEKVQKDYEAAVNDVKVAAGEIFDAMFLKGENVFTSLGNALKGGALSLGRSIFQDITGELLGPIKKAFDDFFTGLLESTGIKKFISGLGSQLGGLLGRIPGLGGIFGGGAAAAGGIGGAAGGVGAGAGAAGAGAGATGGLGASATAFMTNPWTIGVGVGMVGVAAWIKSQAHHEANEIVKNIENPFWEAWGQILPTDNMDALAHLEDGQAERVGSALNEMNQRYLALVDEFSKGGRDEKKVSDQSLGNTQPHALAALAALRQAVTAGGGIPSFEKGTGYVQSDMISELHQGEAVLTKGENSAILSLLEKICIAIERGHVISIDGREVARAAGNAVEFSGVRMLASGVRV